MVPIAVRPRSPVSVRRQTFRFFFALFTSYERFFSACCKYKPEVEIADRWHRLMKVVLRFDEPTLICCLCYGMRSILKPVIFHRSGDIECVLPLQKSTWSGFERCDAVRRKQLTARLSYPVSADMGYSRLRSISFLWKVVEHSPFGTKAPSQRQIQSISWDFKPPNCPRISTDFGNTSLHWIAPCEPSANCHKFVSKGKTETHFWLRIA